METHYLCVSLVTKGKERYAAVQTETKFEDLDLLATSYQLDIFDREGEGTLFAFRDILLSEEICALAVEAYMNELEAELDEAAAEANLGEE